MIAWLLGGLAGRDAGWAGHVPNCHIPRRPERRAATGQRPNRLGRCQHQPIQALRARKKGKEDGRGPSKGRRPEKKDEREEQTGRRPTEGGAGEASAALKVEGANDVQRVEGLAEGNNQLAAKEARKALQYYTMRCKKY